MEPRRFLVQAVRFFLAVLVPGSFIADSANAPAPAAIILMGPSGVGKSETANTLVGANKFQVSAGLESETRAPQAATVTFSGREWQVVDTPGYFDTSLSHAEVDDLMAGFANIVSNHIVALVFVVPYGRFGDAHMRAWRLGRRAFGPGAHNYTALAFTHCGERTDVDVRQEITRLCEKATPPAICTVTAELGDQQRLFAFGQLETARRENDRARLFQLASKLEEANGGRGYDHAEFLRTRARRRSLAIRVSALHSEEDRRLLGLLLEGVEAGSQSDEALVRALEQAEGLGETRWATVDFEDRTLGPFRQVGAGWRQPMPVPYVSMKGFQSAAGAGGRLFLHTGTDSGVRLRHGDKRIGELQSAPFFLGRGAITWEGSGNGGLVAVCKAGSDLLTGCLERRLQSESTLLANGAFEEDELAELQGVAVYLRVVDDRTSGWGFVALDNIAYPMLVTDGDMKNSTKARGLYEQPAKEVEPAEPREVKPAEPQAVKPGEPEASHEKPSWREDVKHDGLIGGTVDWVKDHMPGHKDHPPAMSVHPGSEEGAVE